MGRCDARSRRRWSMLVGAMLMGAMLMGAMLLSPAAMAAEILVADHLGDLWRFGSEVEYRLRIGKLPAPMSGLSFGPEEQLLGVTSNREIWQIDPASGAGQELVAGLEAGQFEYRDLVQIDSETVYLLRWPLTALWPEITRLDLTDGNEQVIAPIQPSEDMEPIQVFSMVLGPAGDSLWLADDRSIYELSLEDLSTTELETPSVDTDLAVFGLARDSGGDLWVLSDWVGKQRQTRLLPADLSSMGYLFNAESRPRAITVRPDPEGCSADPNVLCLQAGRFEVRASWRDFEGQSGVAGRADIQSDSAGQFWFFEAGNRELLVKVLDGCGINGKFWVSAAATSTVEFEVHVKDLTTGAEKSYLNPLGQAAETVLDIDAFVCEPQVFGGQEREVL